MALYFINSRLLNGAGACEIIRAERSLTSTALGPFSACMLYPSKVCPVVIRQCEGRREILAFAHPLAGKQFVKGTIESGEDLLIAARRELREESGLSAPENLIFLGSEIIGDHRQVWAFFAWTALGLPDVWSHRTEDDHGHTFTFFWHPLDLPLDDEWHPIFHEAFTFFAPLISAD